MTEKHTKQVAKLEEALNQAAEVVVVKDSETRIEEDAKREIAPDVYEAMKADISRLEVRDESKLFKSIYAVFSLFVNW